MATYKTICIIPARGGSKGLKNKNSLILRNTHLIGRPIRHVLSANIGCKIFVTTDDSNLQELAIQYGADCPSLRPSIYAKDDTTTEATLKEALERAEAYYGERYDLVLFLTATDVYREPKWISECLNEIISKDDVDSVFIGYKTTKNFWQEVDGKWIRICSWMSEYGSRQTRRYIVREDTGVCLVTKADLIREGIRVGDNIRIIVKDHVLGGLDIHTQADLDISNYALGYIDEE